MSALSRVVEIDGIPCWAKRDVFLRATLYTTRLAKVRHVPLAYWQVCISDTAAEYSIVPPEAMLTVALREAIAREPGRCREFLRRAARRVRMARKRRRGYA
jgi:hypothetical protein